MIRIRTPTLVGLLARARELDGRYPQFVQAHQNYLTENFTFGDYHSCLATSAELRHWQIEEVFHGRKYTRCFLLLAFLFWLVPGLVQAQGDDFGTSFPSPGYINPWIPPFPPSAGGYIFDGIKYGPVQIFARKGDTVVVRYNMRNCSGCYWRFAIVGTSVMSGDSPGWGYNAQNMRYLEPTDGSASDAQQFWHGQLGTWCADCRFAFEAGSDFPWIWIAYTGNPDWYAQLEVLEIIPAPPQPLFSVLSDAAKSTAQRIGGFFSDIGGAFANAGARFGAFPNATVPSYFMALLSYGSWRFADVSYNISLDPWDSDYCSPVEFSYDSQVVNDVEWVRPYDTAAYEWTVASTEIVTSYGLNAYTAANRALTAASDGNMDCAWARRAEAIGLLNGMGYYLWFFEWSLAVTADAWQSDYDMSDIYNSLNGIGEAASFFQGLQ